MKPYISTYYVTPIVSPDESVKIKFYITDWFQKEYRLGEDDSRFMVQILYGVNPHSRKEIVLKNLTAGDHEVDLGKLPVGLYYLSLQCKDTQKRFSHVVYHEFMVIEDRDREISEKDTYRMTQADLKKYGIRNDGNHGTLKLIDVSSVDLKAEDRSVKIQEILDHAAEKDGNPKAGHYVIYAPSSKEGLADFGSFKSRKIVYAENYDFAGVERDALKTAEGLQKLMDDTAAKGYRKLVLLPGTYRISHEKTLLPPSFLTLDLNGSVIKQNPFTGNRSLMMELCDTIDTHVVNGIFEGDYFEHDYKNSPNNAEWVCGVSIGGAARYSSFENIVLQYITGYGSSNGLSDKKGIGYTDVPPAAVGGFTRGDIYRNNGQPNLNFNDVCTSQFVDIRRIVPYQYFTVSKYLGYQGMVSSSWYITVHFYDESQRYLQSIEAYQYRQILIPTNAVYVKVTVPGTNPQMLNQAGLSINTFRFPWNCAYKNVYHLNCRAVGMAQSAMRNFLVEGCEFVRCGETLAKCAYDAEDGWDQMQDVYIHNNYFHDNFLNDFLTCAGHNFIIENNIGKIHLWDRTNSSCVRYNRGPSGTFLCKGHNRTQFLRLKDNVFSESMTVGSENAQTSVDEWVTVVRGKIEAPKLTLG